MQVFLNIIISVIHRCVLTKAGCLTSRFVYIPAVLFTYHSLSLANISFKSEDADEKQAKSLQRYLGIYRWLSQLNLYLVLIPTSLLLFGQTIVVNDGFYLLS